MDLKSRSTDHDRRASDLEALAARMERFHRVSWKEAFGTIASPMLRLQRYRHAHNRLLQGAWCELDCADKGASEA